MDTAYITMLIAFFISTTAAFITGRLLACALVPAFAVGLFASIGALPHFAWFFGLFFMAALPYLFITSTGATLGITLRKQLPNTPTTLIRHGLTTLLARFGKSGVLLLRAYSKAEWNSIANKSAKEFAAHNPEVLIITGTVNYISLSKKSTSANSILPYTCITYYIEGHHGNAMIEIGLSGTGSNPQFVLLSVKKSH
ncbi:hypothetical protein [Jeongeupia naejangsanensis]|uniref:Uncharacterized protein n=1 Tax=Jeongeupia naejangsanensis TaxID=613195 RepID=A0ABS2BL12_9NEIS|nr:hypothetical protein [Jeongeupia naejangsanensis]MBM3116125.1 hypothetical protein [Jeongeupia naejangsanensis]